MCWFQAPCHHVSITSAAEEAMTLVRNTVSISYVDATSFDVLFVVGGTSAPYYDIHCKLGLSCELAATSVPAAAGQFHWADFKIAWSLLLIKP